MAGCDNDITNMLTIVKKAENSNLEITANYTLTMKETKKLIQALDDNCAIVEAIGRL
ncbi:MAG: hypothetical protein QGH06_03845 [Lutibacter sp.]|nr:hypothetical protein [Lutibacter sp.]